MRLSTQKNALLIIGMVLLTLWTSSCKKSPYVPADGDVISLSATVTQLVPGESTTIQITGIKANGMAMPDNTLVRMIADSGKFFDAGDMTKEVQAVLLFGGKASITYQSDEKFEGDVITISAESGTASIQPEQLIFQVRSIDITQLFITVVPLKLPPVGGTASVTVTAYDVQMEVVPDKKIFLETSAGSLSPGSPILTDASGKVQASLTTTETAVVTATYKEIVKTATVDVGINTAPVAAFEFSPQNPTNGDTVYFTSTSSDEEDGTGLSHYWLFGDGGSSRETNPSHSYPEVTEETEFKVVLTVTDSDGKTATAAQSVTVTLVPNEMPVADFVFSPDNPDIGQTVHFTSNSSDPDGEIVTYQWNFGDGSFSSLENPVHSFFPGTPTTYNVKLTVTDDGGNSSSVIKQVPVGNTDNQPPEAAFAFYPEEPVSGDTVRFTSTSTDEDGSIVSYEWELGDGTRSSQKDPDHVYNTAGTYQVTLTVTDDGGLTGSITQPVTVSDPTNVPPVAAFTHSPKDPKDGQTVWFNASTSTDEDGSIVQYQWDFGDGTTFTGTTITASHTYHVTKETTFTVSLTVVDDDGATGTVSQEITVTGPTARTRAKKEN